MHRLDMQISDEEYETMKKIKNIAGCSISDFFRWILDNYDPAKEVTTVSSNDLEREDNPDNKSLYWYNYFDHDLLAREIDKSYSPKYSDLPHYYCVLHKPLGASLVEVLKTQNEQKSKLRDSRIMFEGKLAYLAFDLQNIGNNINQIAKALNVLKKKDAAAVSQFDFDKLNEIVNQLEDKTNHYTQKINEYAKNTQA